MDLEQDLTALEKIVHPVVFPALAQYIRALVGVYGVKEVRIDLERSFPSIISMDEEYIQVEYVVKISGYQN